MGAITINRALRLGSRTGAAVSAAAHGDRNAVSAGKTHCQHDVAAVRPIGYQRRPTIDASVPDPSRRVVAGIFRRHEPPAQMPTKGRNGTRTRRSCHQDVTPFNYETSLARRRVNS
jgi:hypothetical protein